MDHKDTVVSVWRRAGDVLEIEWDDRDEEAFEVLKWQIFSVTGDSVTLIDTSGCEIVSKVDMIDTLMNSDSGIRIARIFAVENETFQSCTTELFGSEPSIFPHYVIDDVMLPICINCSVKFDTSLCQSFLGSTSPALCRSIEAADIGLAKYPVTRSASSRIPLPVKLFLRKFHFRQVISFQSNEYLENSGLFARLKSGCDIVKVFEDKHQQDAARGVIDMAKIMGYAEEYRKENETIRPGEDVCFMQGLMKWFKLDFFKWCNKPPCEVCRAMGDAAPPRAGMDAIGMAEPTADERFRCWAGRIEV
jgi:hypothetical protein